MIKKCSHVLTLSILCAFTLLDMANAQNERDAYQTDLFSTSASPAVEIRTSGGFITVAGHSENEVRVEMFVKRGGNYLTPSDTDLSDFDIVIEQNGDRVTASARRKNSGWFGRNNNTSVSFRVHAPHASIVDGQTSGGSVSGENFTNQLSLTTSGGSVTAANIEGFADLRTSGGTIHLTNVHGSIQAGTSGGSIHAERISGDADFRTSGGSIRLEEISAKITARTSGGSIRANMATFTEDVELLTSGGSIQIALPETNDFELDLTGSRVQTELRNFTGRSERRSVKGKMGNGGPLVKAKTSGGSVELRYY